ncbi:MAG: hypothetical protein QOC55_1009 [Thermoleophilaceae bacterium]|nr:hypothetical protein [Thermoleophilaceae bacterium]
MTTGPIGQWGRPAARCLMVAIACGLLLQTGTAESVVPHRAAASGFPDQNVLNAVDAPGADDAWAVGSSHVRAGLTTLVMHWDGRSWSKVSSPSPVTTGLIGSQLNGVSARSPTDAWAVGTVGGAPLILHWDGAAWKRVKSSVNKGDLYGVHATSPTDAWAVGSGSAFNNKRALLMHWDGTSWTPSAVPAGTPALDGVSALSGSAAWAVGSAGGRRTLALRWNGVGWKRVASANPAGFDWLLGVSALSNGNVWAVGGANNAGSIVLHSAGARWRTSAAPRVSSSAQLMSVSARAARDVWAAGSAYPKTLVMHWNGHSWKRVPAPSPGGAGTGALLAGISARTANDVWAVGDYGTRSGGAKVLILHWTGRRWRVA